jgi:hypothetical protein
MSAYLSVCAIYRDEAPYLEEWLEFHRLVGVERFFLYDNESSDDHATVLAPYVSEGVAVVHHWPEHPAQKEAYEHCLSEHGEESRWIAFIDLDEFLFSPELRPVPELLVEYEQWPGVGVNRVTFGTSGHKEKPAGLAIEEYLMRWPRPESIKSIIDPARTVGFVNVHSFAYTDGGYAVDERKQRIDGWMADEYTFDRLRINHYYTRSEAEFLDKLEHVRADNAQLRKRPKSFRGIAGKERDETITAYVPALRDAISRRVGSGS